MKQGMGRSSVSARKAEPTAHAVNEPKVAEIGIDESRLKSMPLYKGRGYEAPMAGSTTYKSGSQGRH